MAKCRTLVRRGGWMVDGMFDQETGERLVVIEAEGKFTVDEAEHLAEVVRATAQQGPDESA